MVVYGPAYLDRVIRVDQPLLLPSAGPPLDRSVEGTAGAADPSRRMLLVDLQGRTIEILLPPDWPGPFGPIQLRTRLGVVPEIWRRTVATLSWQDDLGGMGAGYAAALRGTLVSALGGADDPIRQAIEALLLKYGIRSRPVCLEDQPTDWTLLVTSGPHGDKLPIGFRGCHEAWSLRPDGAEPPLPSEIRVVAGLPNRLASLLLRAGGASLRLFAPAMRNMTGDPPIADFADAIDLLSCNRGEWETLSPADRLQILEKVPVVLVTDGPAGCIIHYHGADRQGLADRLEVPAFPRAHPPRDTNRAGECFASTFVSTLLDSGWRPGPLSRDRVEQAGRRASAASALVLDLVDFGFPSPSEIDAACASGVVSGHKDS